MMVNAKNMVVNKALTDAAFRRQPEGERANSTRQSGQKEDPGALQRLRETVEERPQRESVMEKLFGKSLKFEIDRELNQVVVKVVDKQSGEVIRQIPPEEYLEIMKRLQDVGGVFMDKEV